MTPESQLIDFIKSIDPERPMMVVRWVDEPRIVPEDETGFTVGHRTYVTLTARLKDGQTMKRLMIENLTLQEIKHVVAHYPVQVLYRSDNQMR